MILGVYGQDGTIARELYLKNNAFVIGVSNKKNQKQEAIYIKNDKYIDLVADFANPVEVSRILDEYKPDRILNFAAAHESSENMSNFEKNFKSLIYDTNYKINENILNWLKKNKNTRYVMALTSKMYTPYQKFTLISEESALEPQNYYGETKKMAFELIKKYRNQFDTYSVGAILFNHTSSFSKEHFLFQQISSQIFRIINFKESVIKIKNFDSFIDVTLANEVLNGICGSLELTSPEDFVFASGKLIKISELTDLTLDRLGLTSEKITLMSSNPKREECFLIGCPQKAETLLKWKHPTNPSQILLDMVLHKIG
jgi:GDPmannose 4,6-dehydratase